MQDNSLNNIQKQPHCSNLQNPNAVNINIYSPSAYSAQPSCNNTNTQNYATNPYANNFYPIYSNSPIAQGMPYPQNYNNLINYPQQSYPNTNGLNYVPNGNQTNKIPGNDSDSLNKVGSSDKKDENETNKSKDEGKEIIPLTDDYIKSLENYLDSNNSNVRMSGIKAVVDRFKEDENRKDNPSLIPLLNKALQDKSPAVRFLALTAIQLGYTKGDDKTVEILNTMVNNDKENFGEDATMASEALLKIATPETVKQGGKQ